MQHRTTRTALLSRIGPAFLIACCLLPQGAWSQAPYSAAVLPGFAGFNLGPHSAPALVDLDGDGDLDLVVGTKGTLAYLKNIGCGALPHFLQATESPFSSLVVGDYPIPTFADLDGDLDLDLLVGSGGTLTYFLNVGDPAVPQFVEASGSGDPFSGILGGAPPALADVDGDQRIDLVLGSAEGENRFFKNTGTVGQPVFVEVTGASNPFSTTTVGDPSAPYLADLDADGDLDLLVGLRWGGPSTFRNIGSPTNPVFEPWGSLFLHSTVDNDSRAAVADLNGDGLVEIVLGEEIGSLRYFHNVGTLAVPSFRESFGITNPLSGPFSLSQTSAGFGDFDADGDMDGVVASWFGLHYYRNASIRSPLYELLSGAESPFTGVVQEGLAYLFPVPFDLDSDGDLDVVAIAGSQLRYLQNVGTANSPQFVERTGTAADPFAGIERGAPAIGNLEGNSDPEVLVARYGGQVVMLRNVGPSSAPVYVEVPEGQNPFANIELGASVEPRLALADFDHDGDLDLLAVGEINLKHGLYYFPNSGSPSLPTFEATPSSDLPFETYTFHVDGVAAVDVDGDGDVDVVGGAGTGQRTFLRSLAHDVYADGFECGVSAWSQTTP